MDIEFPVIKKMPAMNAKYGENVGVTRNNILVYVFYLLLFGLQIPQPSQSKAALILSGICPAGYFSYFTTSKAPMSPGRNGLLGVKEWEDFSEQREIKKTGFRTENDDQHCI